MVKPGPGQYEIRISKGLQGQDDNLDILSSLFEQLQVATIETADPHLDLITFATSAYYFGVITEHYVPPPPKLNSRDKEVKKRVGRTQRKEKAAKEKAQMDQVLESLRKRKSSDGSRPLPPVPWVPLRPSYPPMSTLQRASGSRLEYLEDEERTHSQQFKSSASTAENYWGKPGYSNAIGTNQAFDFDEPALDGQPMGKRATLWGEFESRWEEKPGHITPTLPPVLHTNRPIGIVYLTSSQNIEDPLHVGELNIGIILTEQARGKGYARWAIELVTDMAFAEAKCHRLQAILLNHVAKDRALCLFTEMHFGHEGTRRRSFFSPMELEWKDTTYMAILDTDWVLNKSRGVSSVVRSAPKSLWDELFARHQREREELLRWEFNTNSTLKRSSSTATLRAASPIPTAPPSTSGSEAESEMSDSSSSPRLSYTQKGKRKADAVEDNSQHRSLTGYSVSTSNSEAELDSVNKWRMSSPASESSHPFTDDEENISQDGYESVTSWDALELPTSSSDDMSDSDDSSVYDFADEDP